MIIHDWDDERARNILVSCRAAMKHGATLLVFDRDFPELGSAGNDAEVFMLDLEMLVMTPGGRERTKGEFEALFSSTGFRLDDVVPTNCPLSIFRASAI